jgi:predicted metal-dependent hydrolase
VRELSLSAENWQEFEHGVGLFNAGKFWHAHEAWELIWQQHDEDERLFFQGLIQLAAAYHLLVTKRNLRSMSNNLEKAREKLAVFPAEYLGVAVAPLLANIEEAQSEIDRIGGSDADAFDTGIIPKMQFHKPGNPDLMVEIKDIVREDAFLEGAKLFNGGYFWEAHEAWEVVWRAREGDARAFVQGFVEAAAGCNFAKQAKRTNAIYLLGKSLEKFRQFENLSVGIPLRSFVNELGVLHTTLQCGTSNGKPVTVPRVPLSGN